MRSLNTIINRVMDDLPVTEEEAQALRKHLYQRKKSTDRLVNVLIIGALIGIAVVLLFGANK